MDNKLSLIVAIAVILIIVGGYLIITNQSSGEVIEDSLDIPLKTQDFELFEIDIPKGSNFTVKNEADGMKYYQNDGEYSTNISGIIINKNLTDSLIGDASVPVSNSSSEQIYSFMLKNKTSYKYVSKQGDVDIILIGDDLNLLKEISETIEVKDTDNL
jgi:hypothetical protein